MTPLTARELLLARTFYIATAMATALWWIGLWNNEWVRLAFLGHQAEMWMRVLLLPDLLCAGIMASVLVWALGRHPAIALALAWGVFGGQGYAFLLSIGIATADPVASLGVATMMFSAGACLAFALRLLPIRILWGPFQFQTASSGDPKAHFAYALKQSCLMWLTFLVTIPTAIALIERFFNWQLLGSPELVRWIIAPIGILAVGAIGIMSAWNMAADGDGTPLPSSCPSKLVVSGPYRYVRNPMALGGILQGILVGVMWDSPLVITYAVLGAIWWDVMVRHLEEAHLLENFGDAYETYRNEVRCWLPRLVPYLARVKPRPN